MQTSNHQNSDLEKEINSILNNELLDNDEDFSFKPITQGLGFHKEAKRRLPISKPKPKPKPKSIQKPNIEFSTNDSKSLTNELSGLDAFYSGSEVSISSLEEENQLGVGETIRNSDQLLAWAIDVVIILSVQMATMLLLTIVAKTNGIILANLVQSAEMLILTSTLFVIYFLLYFSILDVSASPGKTIKGVMLVCSTGGRLEVRHTFTRSLIVLLSPFLLFLPLIFNWQSKLSDTTLIRKRNVTVK
ncbi:MAG: hypothetical protein HOJ35_03260 [Bdellovibrionales bacterium]|jgi:hypothetical protein|nr:hypothetical protein [Bdellovibrionales bacterium]